ncbi:MAG: carboxymuconolactone decarboxylase family protein [Acidimicrobiia bacterium]
MSEEFDVRMPPLRRWWLDPVAGPVASLAAVLTRGDPPRIFTTLARHPRLFRRWLVFASSFLVRSELPRADVELVVLRTAWACRSRYEWAQHVSLAGGAGLPPATIARIPDGPDADGWTPRQALLLRAVDELHDHRVVTDATWTALAEELSERQLIELCFLVGHYEMLAMTLNSLGVEPEASALGRLAGTVSDAAESLHQKIGAARRVVADGGEGPRTGRTRAACDEGGRDGRLA